MRIERFQDQYEEAAVAYGVTPQALTDRDHRQTQNVLRWIACDEDRVLGAATGWIRPDNRLFLNFGCPDRAAYRALTSHIAKELARDLYVSLSGSDAQTLDTLTRAGFQVEMVSEVFQVAFASVVEQLPRSFDVSGFRIVSADGIDAEFLLEIDNQLRNVVPGTDGWVGNLEWIEQELAESPPFEPGAYLVCLTENGDPVGLARVWRNPDGPRFGMVATLPEFRHSLVGPELIRRVLLTASSWGFDTFHTETSTENSHVHRRLKKLGALSEGFIYQLVYRTPSASVHSSYL